MQGLVLVWSSLVLVWCGLVLAWSGLVFGVLLFGRWRYGWRGSLAVRMTLAGVVLLVLSYFGTKLVLEVILGRSWQL